MGPVFITFLNDKELISKLSIEELPSIPYNELYFKKELHRESTNTFGKKEHFFKYTIIDKLGKKKDIDIGKYKVTNISPDGINTLIVNGKTTYPIGRDIIVHDTSTKANHVFRSNVKSDDFIINDLLFLINTLSKVQDWEIFINLSRIPVLESEINYLKEKVKKQKEQIIKSVNKG